MLKYKFFNLRAFSKLKLLLFCFFIYAPSCKTEKKRMSCLNKKRENGSFKNLQHSSSLAIPLQIRFSCMMRKCRSHTSNSTDVLSDPLYWDFKETLFDIQYLRPTQTQAPIILIDKIFSRFDTIWILKVSTLQCFLLINIHFI